YDDKSLQFDATSSPIVCAVVSMVQRWEKIDDYRSRSTPMCRSVTSPTWSPGSFLSVRPPGGRRGAVGSSSLRRRAAPGTYLIHRSVLARYQGIVSTRCASASDQTRVAASPG